MVTTVPENVRVGIAAHVCHNGKVLAFERLGKLGTNTWSVLGGHLENGETWEDCALREVHEEAGIKPHSAQLFAVTNDIFPETGKHFVTIHIALKADSAAFTNTEPEKHQHMGWFVWESLPQPRFGCMQQLYLENVKPPYLESDIIR